MTQERIAQFPIIPANKRSLGHRRPVYGVGINDSDYIIKPEINGVRFYCPFYEVWVSMIQRCYSAKLHAKRPTYKGCSTCKEWHSFMAFRAWMEKQDWRGKEIDKDILIEGNKVYSPNTCVFVSAAVNTLFTDSGVARGPYLIGVTWNARENKFVSQCCNSKGVQIRSYHDSEASAHSEWKAQKIKVIELVASFVDDERVRAALIARAKKLAKRTD